MHKDSCGDLGQGEFVRLLTLYLPAVLLLFAQKELPTRWLRLLRWILVQWSDDFIWGVDESPRMASMVCCLPGLRNRWNYGIKLLFRRLTRFWQHSFRWSLDVHTWFSHRWEFVVRWKSVFSIAESLNQILRFLWTRSWSVGKWQKKCFTTQMERIPCVHVVVTKLESQRKNNDEKNWRRQSLWSNKRRG